MFKKIITFIVLALNASFISAQQNPLQQQIEAIIRSKQATVGVAVIGEDEKDPITVNNEHHYPMQSTYKFHLALAVLDQVDNNALSLEQKIHVTGKDLLPDTHSPLRDKYPRGNVDLPLMEILKYTVAQSDNNGCDILFRLLGGVEKVNRYVHDTGIREISIAATEEDMHKDWDIQYTNWSTPLATAQLLEKVYHGKLLSPGSRSFLWNTMVETSTGTQRIKGLLPKDAVVAHKTGSGPTKDNIIAACNDIGIVMLPSGKHFTIVVFIADSKEASNANESIIAEIAKTTWNYFLAKESN